MQVLIGGVKINNSNHRSAGPSLAEREMRWTVFMCLCLCPKVVVESILGYTILQKRIGLISWTELDQTSGYKGISFPIHKSMHGVGRAWCGSCSYPRVLLKELDALGSTMIIWKIWLVGGSGWIKSSLCWPWTGRPRDDVGGIKVFMSIR